MAAILPFLIRLGKNRHHADTHRHIYVIVGGNSKIYFGCVFSEILRFAEYFEKQIFTHTFFFAGNCLKRSQNHFGRRSVSHVRAIDALVIGFES